jgi:alpha-galactosidase
MEIPLIRPAPTGWSSWYIFWAKVAESDVIDNLATAALLADELPLQVIQLDQGFERTWGDWTERNERFPHSLGWWPSVFGGRNALPDCGWLR